MGEPPQAHFEELERDALVTPLEGGIEVIRECNIKATLMIGMGKAAGEVGNSNAEFSAGLCDAVEFHNGPKGVVEMFQNMVGLNQFKVVVRKGVGKAVQVEQHIGFHIGDDVHIEVARFFESPAA